MKVAIAHGPNANAQSTVMMMIAITAYSGIVFPIMYPHATNAIKNPKKSIFVAFFVNCSGYGLSVSGSF